MKFRELERVVVQKLRARVTEGADRKFRVVCDCGDYLGWTKVSRKPNEQIGAPIEAKIPGQLGINRPLWEEISGCRKGWLDYQAALGHAH